MNHTRTNSGALKGAKHILRALRSRNYRLFFGGQSISLIGTWMQQLAMSWLVYRLTHSLLMLGLIGFAAQVPAFLLGPLAGIVSDRFSRRSILIVTQTLSMLQAFALSALVLSHTVAVWHIFALSVFLGLVFAFDAPTRQAFVVEMTERREDLSNAIALNSSMFNGARLVGPSIAGELIHLFGEGVCFLLNGFSYLAVIASLVAMRIPARQVEARPSSALHGLREGFHYAFGFIPIRSLLILIALTSMAGMPYSVLMPAFAKDVLHGGANTLGLLVGASGAGALLGALYMASRKTVLGLGRIIVAATSLFGIALIAFSFSHTLWISMPILFLVGIGMMVQMASCNTILQTIVDEHMRGRVMSFYTMSFMGSMPFGSLLAGYSADKIGAPYTVMLGGLLCIVGAVAFMTRLPELRKMVTPIYVRMGIISD
jgi:MFS family permease